MIKSRTLRKKNILDDLGEQNVNAMVTPGDGQEESESKEGKMTSEHKLKPCAGAEEEGAASHRRQAAARKRRDKEKMPEPNNQANTVFSPRELAWDH